MVCVIYNKRCYKIYRLNFFYLTFEVSRITPRILRTLAKEISNGRREGKRDRPGQGMPLGRLRGWGWGFPWKHNNSSKLQEREHLALEGGGWGKKPGEGDEGLLCADPAPYCWCLSRLNWSVALFLNPTLLPPPALPSFNPDPESGV